MSSFAGQVITLHTTMEELTAELGTIAHPCVLPFLQKLQSGPLLVLACFTCILGMVLRYFIYFDPNSRMNLPPGPRPWPLIGNILLFIDGDNFLYSAMKRVFTGLLGDSINAKLAELASVYGPMFTIWIGSHPIVILAGVKLTRDALVRKAGNFSSRPEKFSWQFFTNGQRTLLTTPDNPYWHKLRRVYTKRMLNPEAVQQYADVRMSEIERSIDAFRRAQSKSEGVGFDPEPIVRVQMSNIITRMNFGDEFDGQGQEIPMGPGGSLIRRSVYMEELCERYRIITMGSVAHLGDYMPTLRHLPSSKAVYADYLSLEAEVKHLLMPIVQACRREMKMRGYNKPGHPSSRENFIDVLLSLEGDEKLSDIEVMWILVELVMGATDTTVGTTHWSLAYCLAFPNAQRRMYEEIVSAVGHERAVVEGDLPKLPYFQAFVKEVMRMRPVVALGAPHCTTEDCKLAGYNIPAKTDVLIHVGRLANDESIWDSPAEFRPERFLNLTETQKQAFIPFGLGKRICPGMYMGLLQVQVTVANLVKRFEWIPGIESGGAVDLSEVLHFIIIPKTKVCASIKERRKMGPQH